MEVWERDFGYSTRINQRDTSLAQRLRQWTQLSRLLMHALGRGSGLAGSRQGRQEESSIFTGVCDQSWPLIVGGGDGGGR